MEQNEVTFTPYTKDSVYGQNMGFGIGQNQQQICQNDQPQQVFGINPLMYNGLPSSTYFANNLNPNMAASNPYQPTVYQMDNLVKVQESKSESQPAIFNPNIFEDVQVKAASQTVGLPMDKLIIESETPTTENVNVSPLAFNQLVSNEPLTPPSQTFGISPIPDGYDRSMLPKPTLVSDAIDEVNAHINKQSAYQSSATKKLNNWFTRLLDQRGQDYISSGKLTIDEVSKNAERIIDDMISGKIDYNKQGNYIILPVILETLINYCANKLAINKAIQFGLGYLYNDYTNQANFQNDSYRSMTLMSIDDSLSRNIAQSIAIVNQDIGVYEILYNKFMYVNATKNASSLFSLTNDLNNYKKQMKKRY